MKSADLRHALDICVATTAWRAGDVFFNILYCWRALAAKVSLPGWAAGGFEPIICWLWTGYAKSLPISGRELYRFAAAHWRFSLAPADNVASTLLQKQQFFVRSDTCIKSGVVLFPTILCQQWHRLKMLGILRF